ncbi:YobA family protein [Bacillus timonensis]|nr:YobA family protein [Bacillus timonensis]
MRIWISLSFLFCFLFVFVGCSSKESSGAVKDLVGHIVNTDSNSILVIEPFRKNPRAASYQLSHDTVIVDDKGNDLSLKDLNPGLYVEVWNDGQVRESYPTQSNAVKVIVKSDEQSKEEALAIQLALTVVDLTQSWSVQSIESLNGALYVIELVSIVAEETPMKIKVDVEQQKVVQ